MYTPRWFRKFCAWRWAPSVVLIAGAFAFVVLALLLIPSGFDTAASAPAVDTARASDSEAPNRAARRTPFVAPTALSTAIVEPGSELVLARAQAPAPAATLVTGEPSVAPTRDFSSNIADRGDRPSRPAHGR